MCDTGQTILKMIALDLSIDKIETYLDTDEMRKFIALEDYRTLIIAECNPLKDPLVPVYWFGAIVKVADLIEQIRTGKKEVESKDKNAAEWKEWLVTLFYKIEQKHGKSIYHEHFAKVVIAHYSLLSVFRCNELTFEMLEPWELCEECKKNNGGF
jgi:hypothetical protein